MAVLVTVILMGPATWPVDAVVAYAMLHELALELGALVVLGTYLQRKGAR